jgi:hypothetical protein
MAQRHTWWLLVSAFITLTLCSTAGADQIEMTNGDRYVGRVVTLGADTLTLQSDVLGTLSLPREKIASVSFSRGSVNRGTNSAAALPLLSRSNSPAHGRLIARTNAFPDLASVMKQLNDNSNMVQQVQQQILGGAGPEAQAKFNDLLSGLMSGTVNMDGLRKEARSTLAQAKSARKDMGDEGSGLDSYLAILDSFLKETDPPESKTNSAATVTPPPRLPVGP